MFAEKPCSKPTSKDARGNQTMEGKRPPTKEGLRRWQTEGVRKYAVEQGIAEEEALKNKGEEKSKEFAEKGNEIYAKA